MQGRAWWHQTQHRDRSAAFAAGTSGENFLQKWGVNCRDRDVDRIFDKPGGKLFRGIRATNIEAEIAQEHTDIRRGRAAARRQKDASFSATTGQVAPWVYQQITQTFVKDPAMHQRLAALNLAATAKVTDRLLEAYQIELEYGRTMSAYKDKLADGREAEFVRLGRVSLYYRTADGAESGYWDNQQKMWVADRNSARLIEQALAIAKEQKAPDLIVVPVPAPQGGRS